MSNCRIVFFIYEGFNILDLTGPLEVLSTSNRMMTESGYNEKYIINICSLNGGRIASDSGIYIDSCCIKEFLNVNINSLVIIGGLNAAKIAKKKDCIFFIKQIEARAERVVSVCSGALILASCGFLENRKVTTHWKALKQIQEYGNICCIPNAIYINDGRFWTSAGVTAGIDLMLEFVRLDCGHNIALLVAQDLICFLKRSGGQEQFSNLLRLQFRSERLHNLKSYVLNELKNEISISKLAQDSGLSQRNYIRAFKKETGMTPLKAVEKIRMEVARNLLIETDASIKVIAFDCGYKNLLSFYRCFVKHYGISPSKVRDNFS